MFQDRLQKLREQHGYSVKEAAAALHLPYTTYNFSTKLRSIEIYHAAPITK